MHQSHCLRETLVIWQTSADEAVLLVDQAVPSGVTDEIPCPPSAILTKIYKTM